MQTLGRLAAEFWHQLTSTLEDLAEYAIYIFDPNSGPWPKIIAGGIIFLLMMFVVTRASKAK